ncbi:glucuronyl hydrolase [Mycoplasmopsis pullorum]|uniref:glycoside hydrolase family 88 protein n=1 Tax=Mycoplasmopsis pullorum TaxID=48003 RepID=UPI00111BB469|nr:glycoside hydrolase family 88 protein [Mycoplasmopsis pullorum]TNK82299.1 glucuronyl hydrolase [Mycoplasmopsis pullorum]TNK82394.1 glucuronyl hydrolase [Mycoplasmopsis pullorum]TNK84564.1 glucuronyl hydrolase [Mycoplasmopsis pullorum]TNK85536.1 glucuronyl hydrolase [Mycoplasmopsis pullorum]TNK86206.1 glucuronyl hydrolase [Mycoplasmopsis pullorum]
MFINNNKELVDIAKLEKNWEKVDKKFLENAIERAIAQIDRNIEYFGDSFQSPNTFSNIYKKMDNVEWTDGFWSGLVLLAYEYTKNPKYLDLAKKHVDSYYDRIVNKIEVNHHDMGFLYSLSCVAYYKLTKDEKAKEAALLAADNLASRYLDEAKFIKAWGNMNEEENYRLIVDCLLNIPLLYWASQNSNDLKRQNYYNIAIEHFNTSLHTVIREDGTTFHTYYFDPKTNQPLFGKTRQGYSDDSCWARGQSWGVYGIPLTLKYAANDPKLDKDTLAIHQKVVNQFLNNIGLDNVAYWDLIFNNDDTHSRDSSASAITVCGLLEVSKFLDSQELKDTYLKISKSIVYSLATKYANLEEHLGSPILFHGVYSWHTNKGVDEGNIWGDYFYLEALMRLYMDWDPYW